MTAPHWRGLADPDSERIPEELREKVTIEHKHPRKSRMHKWGAVYKAMGELAFAETLVVPRSLATSTSTWKNVRNAARLLHKRRFSACLTRNYVIFTNIDESTMSEPIDFSLDFASD